MRRLLCRCVASTLLLSAAFAQAAEWGVLPVPAHMLEATPQDLTNAMGNVKAINAPIHVNVLGWHDLEPKKETYDIDGRLGTLAYGASLGLVPYFGISVINTVRRDVPDDLVDAKWDNPEFLIRFAKMFDAATKKLPQNISYILVGNEVDVYLEKHPDEIDGFLEFFAKASAIVKQHYPAAKVNMSITFEGLIRNKARAEIIARAIKASDDAVFTFYPFFDFHPVPPADTPKLLGTLVEHAQGKDILLQEVGYPSATSLQSSEAQQAEFFKYIIPAINQRPQIKLASIFLLTDFDSKVCNMFTAYYGLSSWSGPSNPFHDFLCSLGVHDADGKPKEAWKTVSDLLRK